ncbi:hypothetical protein HQ545_02375 [Candidatus Woesearchaeota archaeon]|nr:hypothetical protein [Candidatus Woesearchaeota archaeon]
MSPIEIMALLLALFVAVKIITLLVRPKEWMKIPGCVSSHPRLTMVVALVLAFVALYFLLAELTIVQVFAAMLFALLLILSAVSAYPKEMDALAQKMLKEKHILRQAWLPTIMWIALLIWVLYALFA